MFRIPILLAACSLCNLAHAQNLVVSPSSVEFPTVREMMCRSITITATNTGDSSIPRPEVVLTGSDSFATVIRNRRCPETLESNGACRIDVRFCPEWDDTYEATLTFGDVEVPVVGSGMLANSQR